MRMLVAATCSAGIAVVVASPATAAAPSPIAPSDAAIAQYVEVVPSASGLVPVGVPAHATMLTPFVRAKVEQTAGSDARALINITQDSRFGARPVARARSAVADSAKPANPANPANPAQGPKGTAHAVPGQPVAPPTDPPGALAAAAS